MAGGALAVLGLSICVVAWPATTAVALAVWGILIFSVHNPPGGFVVALTAFGFEGSAKVLISQDPPPIGSGASVGAALIDLALFGAIAILLTRDGSSTLRRLWSGSGRFERVGFGLLAGWLATAVLQVWQSDPRRGLAGFRLTEAYTVAALAGAVLFSRRRMPEPTAWLVAGLGLVCGYAALRVATGPTTSEFVFAVGKQTFAEFTGTIFRTVGSFSSTVGMDSFLTPAAVFVLALALLRRRGRWVEAAIGACAVVAIVASYTRTPLLAIGVGLVCCLVLAALGSGMGTRRLVAIAAAIIAVIGTGVALAYVASRQSQPLRTRFDAIVHPGRDKSFQLRRHRLEHRLRGIERHPFGSGVGAIGGANGAKAHARTTDNSYVKVLVEQGWLGGFLFIAGLLVTFAALARRLIRLEPEDRVVGVAALSAFAAFLLLSFTGEFVEQPGKVLAWTLLGVAAAQALRPRPGSAGLDDLGG